jgi:hypothetical protein
VSKGPVSRYYQVLLTWPGYYHCSLSIAFDCDDLQAPDDLLKCLAAMDLFAFRRLQSKRLLTAWTKRLRRGRGRFEPVVRNGGG